MADDKTEREKKVADAILLERAMGALDRRFAREMLHDVTAHAAYQFLRGAAHLLRRQAGQELPPGDEPWADPEYPHVRRDLEEAFARQPERKVFE